MQSSLVSTTENRLFVFAACALVKKKERIKKIKKNCSEPRVNKNGFNLISTKINVREQITIKSSKILYLLYIQTCHLGSCSFVNLCQDVFKQRARFFGRLLVSGALKLFSSHRTLPSDATRKRSLLFILV